MMTIKDLKTKKRALETVTGQQVFVRVGYGMIDTQDGDTIFAQGSTYQVTRIGNKFLTVFVDNDYSDVALEQPDKFVVLLQSAGVTFMYSTTTGNLLK